MNIVTTTREDRVFHYVETDEKGWNLYRRWGPESWELQMGESWESWFDPEIEQLFQDWQNSGI